MKKIAEIKIKFIILIKLHLMFDKFNHSYIPNIITIYINIENNGTRLIPLFPKNKHKRIKGMPIILINVLEFLSSLLIIRFI
tara:strand:- start:71 stop:316 length:246 start_codon:yes stop_codon:yes gene_type:complete